MAQEYRDAFRWVPWICAYTGARVNEVTQMRKQDVKQVDGVWVVNITPEAGRNKTGGAPRADPPAPRRDGAPGLREETQGGPAVLSTARTRGGKDSKSPYKKVGERIAAWVRDARRVRRGREAEPRLAPSPVQHPHRHARPKRVIDSILGHKGADLRNGPPRREEEVIDSIPRVELDATSKRTATAQALETVD